MYDKHSLEKPQLLVSNRNKQPKPSHADSTLQDQLEKIMTWMLP
jgi:hypothetical protein